MNPHNIGFQSGIGTFAAEVGRLGTSRNIEPNFAITADRVIMARNEGLEKIIFDELRTIPGIKDKAMFGGWAWLFRGNLLCGARDDGMLVRLGRGNDDWALAVPGIAPMISRGKRMAGWVRADSRAFGNDEVRRKLIAAAVQFVLSLPEK